MKILLVKLPEPGSEYQKTCVMPPMGLWALQEYLRRNGHECEVIDMHLGELIPSSQSWDIVGLSVQFSVQEELYKQMARELAPRCQKIVAGGVAAAFMDKPPEVSEVCTGAGEVFFSRAGIGGGGHVYPVITPEMMRPYWDEGKPHDLKSATDKWASVEFSRGCDKFCTFCASRAYWGGLEYFSIEDIEAHLFSLTESGITEVFIEDDNFAYDKAMFCRILEALKKTGLWWSAPNGIYTEHLMDAEVRALMRQTNNWRLSIPFETGSEKTARHLSIGSKYMPFAKAKDLVESLVSDGVLVSGFFIIGHPKESLENIAQTLAYANALPLDQRGIYLATPYPGTALHKECVRAGMAFDSKRALYSCAMTQGADWSREDLELIRKMDRLGAVARKELGGN